MRTGSDNPFLTKAFALVFVGVMMPVLLVLAWRMALEFDPFTMSFFTKNRVDPTPGMPGEMRIAGGVIIGLGALLLWSAVQSLRKRLATWKTAGLLALAGLEIAAFGGAFFVAADVVQGMIEQEQMP